MWNVPYAQRPYKRHPGVHTYPLVTWVLAGLIALSGMAVIAAGWYLASIYK